MRRILSLDIKYAGSQIFYFATICAMMGYASVFLLDKGFSNSTIGIVLATCNILAVFFQPMLASFVDKHKDIELSNIICIMTAIATVIAALLYFLPVVGLPILILFVSCFSLMNTIMPLMNSLAFVFEKYGIEVNYGLARGIGSVAYAITSAILGYVVEGFSPSILPLFYVVFNVLLFIVVKTFVLPKNEQYEIVDKSEIKANNEQLSFIQFCVKYKKFILFLGGFILAYFAHMFINNFFFQVVSNIGGSSSDMGQAIFLAAMLELPTMAYFTKLSEKVNCGTLIKISVIMFLVKHAITYFAVNMVMIYIAQAFQMFAYALFIPASVYYVNEKIAEADRVKGQSLITTAMTVSGVFASFLGGFLLDSIGVSNVLLLGAILSVIGVIIVSLSVEKV